MTQKLRVYEYARNQNMTSKEVLEILKRLDIDVRNHMSVMDSEMVTKVEDYIKKLKQKAEPKAKASATKRNSDKKPKSPKGQAKKGNREKPKQPVLSRAEAGPDDEKENIPQKRKTQKKKTVQT
ncbi:translation initiation factor IF-2 domain-containing protein [Caldalkalibacillus thermarum TA2.A1]|uniref:Translation initiation factor IF-2 domain-containing protein n=1 Tax=Caldalkalibacillus thermarum (strain TA2.A1) TaxID=986075 RepID=F5L9U3_CALTT|nr:translation initiation factor IF-2 domain-containing protein [Caldalkalibacillus thermarum TA2.A1]